MNSTTDLVYRHSCVNVVIVNGRVRKLISMGLNVCDNNICSHWPAAYVYCILNQNAHTCTRSKRKKCAYEFYDSQLASIGPFLVALNVLQSYEIFDTRNGIAQNQIKIWADNTCGRNFSPSLCWRISTLKERTQTIAKFCDDPKVTMAGLRSAYAKRNNLIPAACVVTFDPKCKLILSGFLFLYLLYM